jgi:hypothetical protein
LISTGEPLTGGTAAIAIAGDGLALAPPRGATCRTGAGVGGAAAGAAGAGAADAGGGEGSSGSARWTLEDIVGRAWINHTTIPPASTIRIPAIQIMAVMALGGVRDAVSDRKTEKARSFVRASNGFEEGMLSLYCSHRSRAPEIARAQQRSRMHRCRFADQRDVAEEKPLKVCRMYKLS